MARYERVRRESRTEKDERCAACGRMTTERDRIVIAGVAIHLSCALLRRRRTKSYGR
jgi:hypothetical protein